MPPNQEDLETIREIRFRAALRLDEADTPVFKPLVHEATGLGAVAMSDTFTDSVPQTGL